MNVREAKITEIRETYCKKLSRSVSEQLHGDVSEAITFMNRQLFNLKLEVQWVKEQRGISGSDFAARFKANTGWYPKTYIVRHRVEAGKELLRRTQASVTRIAIAVGYSLSSFCKAFKRETGKRPSEWRNSSTAIE